MIYDKTGRMKYLTIKERQAFIEAARKLPADERTFCLMLAFTGARISEVLALTPERIDLEAGIVIIESLKKRRRGIFRAVPVPRYFLQRLEIVHGLAAAQLDSERSTKRIWSWGRTTAWSVIKRVMHVSGTPTILAMPKALRHAFGVGAIQNCVPLNIVQRWMGHSRLSTTAIYADAVGNEEHELAMKMWENIEFNRE
jgi:integrase/recombinase XerD